VSGGILTVGVIVGVALSQGAPNDRSAEPPAGREATYRASETLVTTSEQAITPGMVKTASSADFAATVARLGGSARFSIRWDLPAAAVRVVTTSPVRDDANRTLAIVDSLLRHKLSDAHAGTRPEGPVALETLAQHNA
jgi:hypothetical protein